MQLTTLRRRNLALWLAVLGLTSACALLAAPDGQSQAVMTADPQPVLGSADTETSILGAAPASAPGETWAVRLLPSVVGSVRGGAAPTQFGAPAKPLAPDPQIAFLRTRQGEPGFAVAETPLDEAGAPYRGPIPNEGTGRITPQAGGALMTRDPNRAVGLQDVILRRNPGGRWRALERPGPEVLLPGDADTPPEALAEDRGLGRTALTAVPENGATGVFVAPFGRAVEDAVLHWNGNAWTREPVELPAGSEAAFQIVAIEATSPDNAWALAAPDASLGRALVLFERTDGPDGPLWVERPLGAPRFANAATPGNGLTEVRPLRDGAQPLTVTGDGVWIDGTLRENGASADFTVFFDIGAGAVTRSWCDAAACDAPLGVELSERTGYRSFAWAGSGFGTRVITNPLNPGAGDESNRGTWLRFDGTGFVRMPGAGGSFRAGGAFADSQRGWLDGPVEITPAPRPDRLRTWPVALRAPLGDIDTSPGAAPGALGSEAYAVGLDGGVARYVPGRGWTREFLLTSSDTVNKANLRGVAWPERGRAHAVGDLGEMWQYFGDIDRWEPDPGTPVGFEGNLLDVDFAPGNPDLGYAVGSGGVLLRYGKSWEPEVLPPGTAGRTLTGLAFAGGQALIAAGPDVLVSDGGGPWRIDAGVKALLDTVRTANPAVTAVAGLTDGGAVAAGRDFVIVRDSAGGPWRFSGQPLPGVTPLTVAAYRPSPGGAVRAIASVVPRLPFPSPVSLPPTDPNEPPPILPPIPLPGDGYVVRETDFGWVDEQRTSFAGSGKDRPVKSDPILGFALDGAGNGWAVGGWSGETDFTGRGTSARNPSGRNTRTRVRTGGIYRYGADATTAVPAGVRRVPVRQDTGKARLAVGGNALCETACADQRFQQIGPDRTLAVSLARAGELRAQPGGPRAFLYTGGRSKVSASPQETNRLAELLRSEPTLPTFAVPGASDAPSGASAFKSAFAGFAGPFGSGAAPGGISNAGIPGAAAGPGARTHYAFDTSGAQGPLRVIVIDNSAGSLSASDPYQNPAEPQLPWIASVLDDAKAKGIPAVVMGHRDLNTRFTPKLNVAGDGDAVAALLVERGASAYVFDRPEENRSYRIPAGATKTIPTFGTGTLGYRSPIVGATRPTGPDSLFGDSGILLLEVDLGARDPATNRAPASARLVPVVEDVSLEAVDGTLLRRSRPALFRGLGRRARAGDRWGPIAAGDRNPDPPGGDPYTNFPPDLCRVAGCSARVPAEYTFTSSDPDIADFVRQDPLSANLRKPFIDANDKVVSDPKSGLLCPFNAGMTTVTISAGSFSFSQQLRVQQGSVLRPCGTRPLRPDRFTRPQPTATPPPPPPPPAAPQGGPPISFNPPPSAPVPGPAPAPPPVAVQAITPTPAPRPMTMLPPVPIQAIEPARVLPTVPPPPPVAARPTPPGGAPARVYQVEEKREDEVATEESQAFSRYEPGGDGSSIPTGALVLGLLVLAAAAGSTVRPTPGRRDRHRVRPAPVTTDFSNPFGPHDPGGPRP